MHLRNVLVLNRRRHFILLLSYFIGFLLLTVINSIGQPLVYTPVPQNETSLQLLAEKFEKKYKDDIAALPAENKGDFEKVYKLRWENIKSKFENKEIYTSALAQTYLDGLLKEIISKNPLISKLDLHCYFSRSGVPNATYVGQGIIMFNMGLFYRLENESQAAFVLSHEIAHAYLQHSENSIRNYVATLNSKEFQDELKRIKKLEFGKRDLLEKLVKGFSFNSMKHSRNHESQADSMAVVLMRNTKFDTRQAATTLALLDSIDKDSVNIVEILPAMFNKPEYPFQKKWMKKEEGLLSGHTELEENKELADSLKTHPDCKQRIKVLEPFIATNSGNAGPLPSAEFISLKDNFLYEIVEYAFASDRYTSSLYYTIKYLQKKPNDIYLLTQVGKIMNGFYAAQKGHTLGRVADLPAPYYSKHYNQLLQFIQNLYLENYASLSYHFLKQYTAVANGYGPFKKAYDTSIQIAKE